MMKQYFRNNIYRNMKNIDSIKFREELKNNLELLRDDITYTQFEQTFMGQLDKYAPIKEKSIRANSQPFMNKTINKAIMNRSRFKNKFIKTLKFLLLNYECMDSHALLTSKLRVAVNFCMHSLLQYGS